MSLRSGVSGAVGLLTLASGFLSIFLVVETFVQILASVTVFAETMIEKIVAKFCLILEIEKTFVPDLFFIMSKCALEISRKVTNCLNGQKPRSYQNLHL